MLGTQQLSTLTIQKYPRTTHSAPGTGTCQGTALPTGVNMPAGMKDCGMSWEWGLWKKTPQSQHGTVITAGSSEASPGV